MFNKRNNTKKEEELFTKLILKLYKKHYFYFSGCLKDDRGSEYYTANLHDFEFTLREKLYTMVCVTVNTEIILDVNWGKETFKFSCWSDGNKNKSLERLFNMLKDEEYSIKEAIVKDEDTTKALYINNLRNVLGNRIK